MVHAFTRRGACALLTLAPFAASRARAQSAPYLDIRGGSNFKPVPIAVTTFQGDGGTQVSSVITNNFRRSVFITPLDASKFIEKAPNPEAPNMDQWRAINAQFVLTGRTGRGPDGRLKTEFRLFDVTSGQQVAGQQYVTDANNARRVAHLVSDAVFTRITGDRKSTRLNSSH